MRFLAPSLAIIKYIGTTNKQFRGKAHGRKFIEVKPGDHIIIDSVTAVLLTRKLDFKAVEHEVDIFPFLLNDTGEESLVALGLSDTQLFSEMIERGFIDFAEDDAPMLTAADERSNNQINKQLEAFKKANNESFQDKVALVKENSELKEIIEELKVRISTLETSAGESDEKGPSDEKDADGVDDTQTEEVVITKENIMDESVVTLKMIKAACKKHNITIGKKKRPALVSLLLPYLKK